jgi:branched-chain amino acid transport system substrate-binding protein
MSKTSTTMTALFLIVGLVIGYGGATLLAPPPELSGLQGEVKIGVIVDLSGALTTYGEDIKAAYEVGIEDVNAYLSAAGASWTISAEFEDGASSPETGLEKFESLVGRGNKIILGPMISPACSSVMSYATANDIIYITPSATAAELAIPNDNLFRLCAIDDLQAPAMAVSMYSAGIRAMVCVYIDNTWGVGLFNGATEKFEDLGGTVFPETEGGIGWDPATIEFSGVIESLDSAVNEALTAGFTLEEIGVLWISYSEVVSAFPIALDYSNLRSIKWFGSDGTVMLTSIADLDGSPDPTQFALDTQFTSTMFKILETPKYNDVHDRIVAKVSREPTIYAYSAYDSVWLAVLGLSAANDYDAMKVKDVLPTVAEIYTGATGNIMLNENGDLAGADYALWRPVETDGVVAWQSVGTYYSQTETVVWD